MTMTEGIENDLAALLNDPPKSIGELVSAISPAIYSKLKTAIELGKWEDGRRLDKSQLEQCMQLVILYEVEKLPEAERTGADLKKTCSSESQQERGPGIEENVIVIKDKQ